MLGMKKFELNRLKITGPITEHTPICVISEIAFCFKFDIDLAKLGAQHYVDKIIAAISMSKSTFVYESPYQAPELHGFSMDDMQHIATFVNGDSNVKRSVVSLIQGFRHLIQFYETVPQDINFVIGQKTNEQPLAYNACILYRVCMYYGIKTRRDTSIHQMAQSLRFLFRETESLKEEIGTAIKYFSKPDLVNLIMSVEMKVTQSPNIRNMTSYPEITFHEKQPPCFSSSSSSADLNAVFSRLTDTKNLLLRIMPESQDESVVLSAIIYGISIVEAENPYVEYMAMKSITLNSVTSNRYVPVDPNFRKRYMKNPLWFDVRRTWTPAIMKIYTAQNIKDFAIAEGYEEEINSGQPPEELLHLSRCVDTFYVGIHPDCNVSKTMIEMDSMDEPNRKMLVSYGIADAQHKFSLYKISELTTCFLNTMSFADPENASKQFSKNSIEKLKYIAYEQIGKKPPKKDMISQAQAPRSMGILNSLLSQLGYTEPAPVQSREIESVVLQSEVEIEYTKLLSVIDQIEAYNAKLPPAVKNLFLYAREQRKIVEEFINLLLEMGYYMRGWKISSHDLPLSKKDTMFPASKQIEVDRNASLAISNFEMFLQEQEPRFQDIVRQLPLMSCQIRNGINGSEAVFEINKNEDKGLTILDRIALVKRGESDSNSYGCIRMSSCCILYSAHYYCKSCMNKEAFDIMKLAFIT